MDPMNEQAWSDMEAWQGALSDILSVAETLPSSKREKLERAAGVLTPVLPELPGLDDDWQPIETAPKGGALIDVWCPAVGRVADVQWVPFLNDFARAVTIEGGLGWTHPLCDVGDGPALYDWSHAPRLHKPGCKGLGLVGAMGGKCNCGFYAEQGD